MKKNITDVLKNNQKYQKNQFYKSLYAKNRPKSTILMM